MKYFYIFIIVLAGCSTKNDNSEKLTNNLHSTELAPKPDSLTSKVNLKKEPKNESGQLKIKDSNSEKVFVDRVHYFQSTNEAYVWVNFKEGFDWRALDSLKLHADSIIYQDGETTRTRYPMQKARKYFDLNFLDGISIFNYSHVFQGRSKLKRIEYFEDVLGDQIIGILEPPNNLKGDRFYGINGTTEFTSSLSTQDTNNELLKEEIKDFIGHESKYDWRFGTTHVKPYNITFAFYSFLTEEDIEKSYLFVSSENDLIKMAETTNEYSIWELSPIKLQINNYPILLLWVGYPETDSEWYIPAVYDGSKYIITNSRIINLSKFKESTEIALKENSLKCDIDVFVDLNKKLNNLTETELDNFLKTFSTECNNNVEFSEWSNELLYEVINSYPKEFITLLNDSSSIYELQVIYDELQAPLTDKYIPNIIIEKIKSLNIKSPQSDSVISALEIAQSKY